MLLRCPKSVTNVSAMHPIDRYVESVGINRAELARRLKCSQQYLADIVSGRTRIGGRTAEKLVKLSGGGVSYGELFEWRPVGGDDGRSAA